MSLLPPFIFLVDTNVLYRVMMKLYILASLRCYQFLWQQAAFRVAIDRSRLFPWGSCHAVFPTLVNGSRLFFFLFLLFFLQIVSKIMRGYLHGLWFNWKVAIMYTALPWMLVNNNKEEGNPSICRIQALWLTILVWHSPCSRSIRREDRSAAASGSLLALIHPLLVFKSGALLH